MFIQLDEGGTNLEGGNDDLDSCKLRVNSQEDQHSEEDDRPELRQWHFGQGVRENHKHQSRALRYHLANLFALEKVLKCQNKLLLFKTS